ncbi:LIM domain-containing protein [Cordyceps javanica]|uniref:LIM domain-containing protein n=1 Tax=Cordyceps javanica TaxID=43265 RepID=A0A545VSR1_9HYPO|nr:LIM domain-containing protein [Cordyceps javanica]TQW04753.1 LIM domain containing protein [Cordyceps javanica]
MALPRESAFLPTIKCSQCGNDVEISMMGEHLCNVPDTPECSELRASVARADADSIIVSPPLGAQETFASAYQTTRNKYLQTPPPVDTRAANRYLNQGQISPTSHSSSSRDTSPKTPSRRSGASKRFNDDYAPEIANPDDGQRSPRGYGRRPGGYGGFGNPTPEPESTEATEPPSKEAPAASFFQRMGEIAGGYGGFGARSAPPEKPVETQPEQEPSKEATGLLQRINDFAGAALDAGRRPSAPNKTPIPDRTDSLQQLDSLPDLTVPEQKPPARKNGYGGFNEPALSDTSSRGMARAETFPRSSSSNDVPGNRSPGFGLQPDMQRRPSAPLPRGSDVRRKPSMGPDTSRRPPPRTSLITPRSNTSSVDLDKEFGIRNPYHTPTDSMSSGYSSQSEHSYLPAKNSPDRSAERNNPGFASRPRQPRQPPKPDNSAPPRRENARPKLQIDPAIQAPQRGPDRFVESPYSASPRDRYDPAIQSGIPGGGRGDRYGSPPRQYGYSDANSSSARSDRYGAAMRSPLPAPSRQGSRDGGVNPPSRGDCKACRGPITGKSISSADGRLTGKYHKACFVCSTCSRPFTSAEFYVHRDRPYCEIHYHKLNGSLCGACDRGIEGQYAEDEARVKYHVGCFRCLDCGLSLSDGYFEVDGKPYCERDAWHRVESEMPPLSPPFPVEADYRGGGSQSMKAAPAPPRSRDGRGGQASRGVGAGMERGPYGVAPGSRGRLNKRMTRIGVM